MTDCERRLKNLLTGLALGGAAGLAYAWLADRLGFGLPCPFYQLTGLQCPGCGVSRMCLALLRGDFAGAWAANPALCLLLPVIAALLLCRGVGYVQGRPVSRWESRSWLVLAGALVLFGVVRNLG